MHSRIASADRKLINLSETGELVITEATPKAFWPLARVQVLGGRCWTAPALASGRIYCRNAKGDLVCIQPSGSADAPRPGIPSQPSRQTAHRMS